MTLECTWLGWAGVALRAAGSRLLIDPLGDPGAIYAALGPGAADGVTLPQVAAPALDGLADGALLTHLHRDHADAGALTGSLRPGAPVFIPRGSAAVGGADAGLAQARHELGAAGLRLVEVDAWERFELGAFTVTALPAVDGTGDPQLSWVVAGGDRRIVHAGDTLLHGWWWRAAMELGPFDAGFLPINGAVLDFPWRQPASPLPAAMTPEEAAVVGRVAAIDTVVPIHFGGFDLDPYYRSIPDALERLRAAAIRQGVHTVQLEVGASLRLGAAMQPL